VSKGPHRIAPTTNATDKQLAVTPSTETAAAAATDPERVKSMVRKLDHGP